MSVKRASKRDCETALPEALRLGDKTEKRPKKKKLPLPVGVVWWTKAEGHPMQKFVGSEVRAQRKNRGWALEDLADITGLGKSTLSELENGKHTPSLTDIILLETAFGMEMGGLERLAYRHWQEQEGKTTLADKVVKMVRQARRAWRRGVLASWLGSLFPLEKEVPCEGLAG